MVITLDIKTLVEIFAVFGGLVAFVICVLAAMVFYQISVLKRVGWVLSSLQDLVDMMLDDEDNDDREDPQEPQEPEDPIDQLIQDVLKDGKKKKK